VHKLLRPGFGNARESPWRRYSISTLSIEEAARHLQAVENQMKKKTASPAKDGGGQLLLAEEQWKAKYKASSGEKSGGRDNGGGGGRGGRHGDGGSGSRERREDFGRLDGPIEQCCFRCSKPGHFARDCRAKKKSGQGQANLAQEESTLLLMEREVVCFDLTPSVGGEISKPSTPHSNSLPAAATGVAGLSTMTLGPVHLLEETVFT
jgi:hypothetical protein